MTQPDSLERVVTCHTEDCVNAEFPITVTLADENSWVLCGPCGRPITDVVEVSDG